MASVEAEPRVIEGARARPGAFDCLRVYDFRLLWIGLVVASTTQPLQFFAQSWLILEHADSSVRVLLLGSLGALRGASMLGFGIVGGALADRMDRRRLLVLTQATALVLGAIIGLVIIIEPMHGAPFLALMFVLFAGQAAVQSVDLPTRQALAPRLVSKELLPQAVALTAMAMQLSLPVSIFLAGTLVDLIDVGPAYLVSTSGYVAVLVALMAMRTGDTRPEMTTANVSVFQNVRDGLGFARRDITILGIVGVMVVVNSLAQPVVNTLAPAWFSEVLGLSAGGASRIIAFWGLGSIITSLTLAYLQDRRFQGATFFVSATAFGLSIVGLGLARWLPAVALCYVGLGAFSMLTQVSATTLLQMIVPNEYLGRIMSLLMLTQGLSQLNGLTIGLIGQGAGLEATVPSLGILCVLLVAVLAMILPTVRRIDRFEAQRAEVGAGA